MLQLQRINLLILFFFFNDTATTEIYTLSLHDALPISAMITSAVRCCTPRIVQSSSTALAKGRICSSIASESPSICSSRKSMWARIAETTIPCSASKRPSSASRSAGSFCRSLPLASSASTAGSVVPRQSASSIARPGGSEDVGGDAVELDPGVLEGLVQPVGLALALPDLRLAVAGQVAQGADRLRRHEARLQQHGLEQLAEPGRVGNVGLAAGHLLDMTRVDEQAVELVLQDRPVGSGRGAVSAFRPARFLGPPSEPDVRVSTHPALHEPMPSSHAGDPAVVAVDQGVAMLVCR